MAYSEKLAIRVRELFAQMQKVEEKKMMGGLTFMVKDKMCVGVLKDELMVRIDPDIYESALKKAGCKEMNFTGRPMKGFVFVSPEGTNTESDLKSWIALALQYNKKQNHQRKRNEIFLNLNFKLKRFTKTKIQLTFAVAESKVGPDRYFFFRYNAEPNP